MSSFVVSVCIDRVTTLYGYLAPIYLPVLFVIGCTWSACQYWLFVLHYM